jgi:hypothetical protein
MFVRVVLYPNRALPPGASSVKYFRMCYSMFLGWHQTPQNASALTYFIALFFFKMQ